MERSIATTNFSSLSKNPNISGPPVKKPGAKTLTAHV